ncbi:hypothetical protein KDH_78590 [Dictyobacter sp. S3.2.2.5]|uniref:Uncharacterized protein n=1 Tax=Dictyobacter halimunensis TaxID=3026934 RepID=A0ABQ6G649_9CHLR|nr:hypothetical protein KDH_78590 [Dictyobacter sp. S3.2.2.5]
MGKGGRPGMGAAARKAEASSAPMGWRDFVGWELIGGLIHMIITEVIYGFINQEREKRYEEKSENEAEGEEGKGDVGIGGGGCAGGRWMGGVVRRGSEAGADGAGGDASEKST